MSHAQAIVVGGGPAGAVAATLLARRGWRTTLVDRSDRGRGKCCGDCVHPRAVALLEHLGFQVAQLGGSATRVGEVWRIADDTNRPIARQRLAAGGLAISRRLLDASLLATAECAGVTIRHRALARWSAEGLLVDGMLAPAALVVAADGLGSGIARAAGLARPGAGRKFGFALDVPLHGCDCSTWPRESIAMLVADGGYLGVVREHDDEGDRLHLAGCVRVGRGLPTEPRACARWFAARHRPLAAAIRSATLDLSRVVGAGPMPWRTVARTAGPLALVGDAAGYAEPFTGEGIAWAVTSAQALVDSTREPGVWGERERARYEWAWRRRVLRGHRRCGIVAHLIARPGLVHLIGSVARAAPLLTRGTLRTLVSR